MHKATLACRLAKGSRVLSSFTSVPLPCLRVSKAARSLQPSSLAANLASCFRLHTVLEKLDC